MKSFFVRTSLLGSTLAALAAAQPAPATAPSAPVVPAPTAAPAVPAAAARPMAPLPVQAPPQAAAPQQPAPAPQPGADQPLVAPPPAPYATTAMVTDISPTSGQPAPEADDASAADAIGPEAQPRFSLALNVDELWHTQKSYDLFSDNDLQVSVGASVGYAVWINGPWSVVPEVGFGIDQSSGGSRYGGAIESAQLDSVRGYAGGRVRYLLLPFLEPHVRLAAGLESLGASVRSDTGESFERTAHPIFGSLGAGFSLHTLPGALTRKRGGLGTLVVGAIVEGGYTVAQSVDLALAPAGAAPRAQTETTSFGTLERSGPYVRIAADVRF